MRPGPVPTCSTIVWHCLTGSVGLYGNMCQRICQIGLTLTSEDGCAIKNNISYGDLLCGLCLRSCKDREEGTEGTKEKLICSSSKIKREEQL